MNTAAEPLGADLKSVDPKLLDTWARWIPVILPGAEVSIPDVDGNYTRFVVYSSTPDDISGTYMNILICRETGERRVYTTEELNRIGTVLILSQMDVYRQMKRKEKGES